MATRPYARVEGGTGSDMPGTEPLRLQAAPDRARLPLPPRGRLVVVDAHAHAFRAFWALEPMHAPDGFPTNALYGLAGLLRRIVFDERPDYVAVVFDAPDDVRRTFRTTLYPDYKAHRPDRPDELARQIPLLRDVARACGLEPLEHPDFEADDLIATLVKQAEAADVHTTILSADKDLLQLVTDRTLMWDAMRGKRYTPAAVEEKLGVVPGLVADYLALCGDTSDNVPGVPGIGPKSATALLRTYGDLAAIYAAIDDVPARERKKLLEHRERAFLSRSLTRLRADVPLAIDLKGLSLPAVTRELGEPLWARLGFASFLPMEEPGTRRGWRPERSGGADGAVGQGAQRAEVIAPGESFGLFDAHEVAQSVRAPVDVDDLAGLGAALLEARAALALGLALIGGTQEVLAPTSRESARLSRRAEHGFVAPVVGLALPSGASWRISLRGGARGLPGRAIQGRLFEVDEAEVGLTLSDLAAALGSLLADPRRVLCVHDVDRLPALGIAPARAMRIGALAQERAREGVQLDPSGAALEALSSWLESDFNAVGVA